MIRITCTNCQKPLSLDETKLPMREVSFPCPVCKTRLTIDRTAMAPTGEAAAEAASAAPAPQPHEEDHADDFGSKALIVGKDDPLLRQAAKLMGYLPVFHADPMKARDYFNQEFPQVVILNPPQITPPPLESMGPMMGLIPADRRKSFFVLVADNLRTLDGNAAFLYGVNLVVSSKDAAQLPQIYREAHVEHERMYASLNAVVRERQLT
jgi:hypothetical protein